MSKIDQENNPIEVTPGAQASQTPQAVEMTAFTASEGVVSNPQNPRQDQVAATRQTPVNETQSISQPEVPQEVLVNTAPQAQEIPQNIPQAGSQVPNEEQLQGLQQEVVVNNAQDLSERGLQQDVAPAPLEQASLEQAPLEQVPLEQAPLEQTSLEAPLERAPLEQVPLEAPVEQVPEQALEQLPEQALEQLPEQALAEAPAQEFAEGESVAQEVAEQEVVTQEFAEEGPSDYAAPAPQTKRISAVLIDIMLKILNYPQEVQSKVEYFITTAFNYPPLTVHAVDTSQLRQFAKTDEKSSGGMSR